MIEIRKQSSGVAAMAVSTEELGRINRFAQRELKAEEVYTFAVRLCDNEVDRDYERFDAMCLAELGALFEGKSGIFDHNWTAQGQMARIYRTEVIREEGQATAAGDTYCWLKGWAYMLRTEKTEELIREIEGGIKKRSERGLQREAPHLLRLRQREWLRARAREGIRRQTVLRDPRRGGGRLRVVLCGGARSEESGCSEKGEEMHGTEGVGGTKRRGAAGEGTGRPGEGG